MAKQPSRIIYVPQYPTKCRYQEWHYHELKEIFENNFEEVLCLGMDSINEIELSTSDMFSPIEKAIQLETRQINEYYSLELRDDDILYMSDISFPGIFGSVLFHKRPKHCYAYCHGTSRNNIDYFASDRNTKWRVETSHSMLFTKVFVATEYHKEKLGWKNIEVIGLPHMKYDYPNYSEREYEIVSVSRLTKQKINRTVEMYVEEKLNNKVLRKTFSNWTEYFDFLAKSKIVFLTGREETYGYQVIDAINCGCIPIAPNKLAYPELIDREWLYDTPDEAAEKIIKNLNDPVLPKIKTEIQANNFYNSILEGMKF